MSPPSSSVIVIGGGISGLSAAYELAQRQTTFTLLEASPRLGGLIRTEHVDGFTIEAGPDSVLAQKPAALQLFDELGLTPRVISSLPPRSAFILRGSRLFAIPSPSVLGIPLSWRTLLAYDLLTPAARARLAMEPLVPRARFPADESVASFFARRFGRSTVPLIAAPLLGGIHAGRIDTLSMHSLFPRFVEAERHRGGVIRAFRRNHPGAAEGAFRSLSSGMGELISSIGRRLPPGSVRLSAAAESLRLDADGWHVRTAQGDLAARSVILAAPAYAAARLLTSIDQEASALCATVQYASTASVALAYRREQVAHPLEGSGFVVARTPRDPRRLTACTWMSSKWAGRAPQGHVLLRAFAGSASDPAVIDLDDAELVNLAVRELTPLLGITGQPTLARVQRWPDASAQHTVGHLARVARLDARVAQSPGLFVAGSGFRSIGIPDCVAHGRSAGAAAAEFVKRGLDAIN